MKASSEHFDDGIRLDGKIVVVTGAASGMGRAIARAVADAGAKVAALDVDEAGLQQLGQEEVFAPGYLAHVTNIARRADCEQAVAQVVDRFGGIDVLVNCAGISMVPLTPEGMMRLPNFFEIDPSGIELMMAINALGPQILTRLVLDVMKPRGWGRIVNITTSFDTMLAPGMSVYGAAKASLEASTAVWAKELEGSGITANVLVPGGMAATPFLPPHMRATALPPEVMQAPMRWLASELSDGVTGSRFVGSLWDKGLGPNEAAKQGRQPVAWPAQAASAEHKRAQAASVE